MKRIPLAPLIVLFAVGCAIGPSGGARPDTSPPAAYRPPSASEDSMRPKYDSLSMSRDSMAARRRDTAAYKSDAAAQSVTRIDFTLSDTAANVSWFDLFQDTVLKQLVIEAINNNRDVRVAVATIQEFQADLGVATGNLFPDITLNGQSGRQKTTFGKISLPGSTTPLSFPPQNYALATANVQWELDFWGRLRNTRSAAKADLLAQQESRRSVVLTLVSNVAATYLTLRQLDLELEVAKRTLASRQETFRLASERLSRGYIAELDARQFQGDVGDAAATVATYQKQIAQQENELRLLLGQQPGPIPRGRPLNEVLTSIDLPVGLPSSLLDHRPDVRQSEAEYQGATRRVGAAIDARLPKFTITGDWGFQNFDLSHWFPQGSFINGNNQIYQVYVGVSIPIFDFGVLANQQHAAEARRSEARYTYEKTVLTAMRDVNNYLAEVRNDREQVTALQTEVQALRIAYQLSLDRYNAGYSAYLDVLTAERSLFVAEQALIAAQGTALVGVVDLYQSLGGGWPLPAKKEAGGKVTFP
ncbi:MAG TPA: efflux transporter outer membrane subunit [Gemmatimonadaceae bacterium]|nr:efflux transporter outer membrane subunit [Gemmatimonadaceae bacterium]